jgi:hypothetical protein
MRFDRWGRSVSRERRLAARLVVDRADSPLKYRTARDATLWYCRRQQVKHFVVFSHVLGSDF